VHTWPREAAQQRDLIANIGLGADQCTGNFVRTLHTASRPGQDRSSQYHSGLDGHNLGWRWRATGFALEDPAIVESNVASHQKGSKCQNLDFGGDRLPTDLHDEKLFEHITRCIVISALKRCDCPKHAC
jgi:hypothetical protein